MSNQKQFIHYFLLIIVLFNIHTSHAMKRKAEKQIDATRLHKRARASDTIAHQLWLDHTCKKYEALNQELNNAFSTAKQKLSNSTHINTVDELLTTIKNDSTLKQHYKTLKCLKFGVDGAQQAVQTLQSLQGTQVFTDAINAILTSEFSKPREQVLSAFQQTLFIIESAIKDLYNTNIAIHNNNQTFKQLLTAHNDDFSTTLCSIQLVVKNLLQNSRIPQQNYNHLYNLICGYQGVLDAIEVESQLHIQLPETKEKK